MSVFYSIAQAMNGAHSIAYSAIRWLGLLFGLIPKAGRFPQVIYYLIHYAFIIGVTAVLAYYSTWLIPEARVPISNWFVQRYYVAIQFILFYLFVRLLISGIQLFLAQDIADFEDIDRAWEAGLEALAREGFDLQWLPVFLVNGMTAEQRKSLFDSARLDWKVNGNSDDPRLSALSFYACDEALFICLNDVGAMSRQLKQPAPAHGRVAAAAAAPSNPGGQATLQPGQVQAALGQSRGPEQVQSPVGKTLPPGAAASHASPHPPSGRFGETIRPGDVSDVIRQQPVVRPVMNEKLGQDEIRFGRRRLAYLGQRLVAERGSYCPLNGYLQVIPVHWTQSAAYEPLFAAIADDMKTLHNTLHMQFPVICLQAGLEQITGLPQFVQRGKELDTRFPDSRAGSRFPAGLPVDEKSATWVVDHGLLWFRDWVYAEFAKNLASPQNRQLYQFLCALSTRRSRFIRELRTILGEVLPVRLTGCYFAATGTEPSQQAFVHGVIQRLMSEQNDVAWNPGWRAHNQRLLFLSFLVFLMTLGLLAVDGYLAWQIWERASLVATG